MTYRAPLQQINFLLDQVLNFERVSQTSKFSEASQDLVHGVLDEASKLAEEKMAPAQRPGDLEGAVLENGVVRTPKEFKTAYNAIAEGGWVGINADPSHGGMGLPITLTTAVGEMLSGACLALSLNPLMTQGQIEALEAQASDDLKSIYLPKLISGQWAGTMNLTEPQAGSDVGALRSKATRNDDGTYSISGQKIYISWGDHDLVENICHLVLARLPDGQAGTKGISLFMVPKFIPDENGNPGKRNSLQVVSLEEKLGLHGSPTAVMEYDEATGWLVGEEHGGMATMFIMMNNARLGVGVQGLGQAEAALQHAQDYAMGRKQGKTRAGDTAIIDHADVRRMILDMQVLTHVARGLCLETAISIDMANATGEKTWNDRAAFLTPLAKAFGTDIGSEVADIGVQIHGGMGYVEETGAAQYLRDVRVTRIYEGTNGIQAMDLIGRKFRDSGHMARSVMDEVRAEIENAGTWSETLAKSVDAVSEAIDWMANASFEDRAAGGTAFLRALCLTIGGGYFAKGLKQGTARHATQAEFFANNHLTLVPALCQAAMSGAQNLFDLDAEQLIGA